MDLAQPEHEMLFDGVQFARVRFEGHFKPDWFRKCHFANCVFSSRLQAPDLARGGNSEDGTIFQRQ